MYKSPIHISAFVKKKRFLLSLDSRESVVKDVEWFEGEEEYNR